MNTEIVTERLRQKPFRPFAIETVGGSWIDVEREEDLMVADRTPPVRIVLFSNNGRLWILGPEQIATIESR
jgi:chorismate-pyruvate lyase